MEVGRAEPHLEHTIPDGWVAEPSTLPSSQCPGPAGGMEGGSLEAEHCWSTLKQKAKTGKEPESLTMTLIT